MFARTSQRPPQVRRQSGSVVVYTGVTLMAILLSAVIAIELGRVYSANRDLEKMASIAAMDAVRDVGRCSRALPPTQAELEQRVQASLTRNGVLGNLASFGVVAGKIRSESGTGRRFLQPSSLSEATAVRVTLRRTFPALLTRLTPSDGRLMIASATAEQPLSGTFEVGSGLASLSGGLLNSLLGGLIGANLGVVDYTGLAQVNITLQQLATAVGLNVQDLSNTLALQAQAPVLANTLQGLSTTLNGTVNQSVIGLLNNLASAATASGNNATTSLANLLGAYDVTAPAAPVVNLLDLIFDLAAATRADTNGAVIPLSLPATVISVPNVTTLATGLKVLEAPRQGRGRPGDASATASTAQIRLTVRAQVSALTQITNALNLVLLGGLLGQVTAPPINLGFDIDVAKASAFLDRIDCPANGVNGGRPVVALSAQPAVASVKLGTYTGTPGTFPAITNGSSQLLAVGIKVLGGLIANINVNLFLANPVSTTVGSSSPIPLPNTVIDFTAASKTTDMGSELWLAQGAPPAAPIANRNPQTVGSTNLLRNTFSTLFSSLNITASDPAHASNSNVCVLLLLCIPVGNILDAVLTPVKSVLSAVLGGVGGVVDALVDPLLAALGVKAGSATVIMRSVTTDQPVVVSHCRPDLPPASALGCPTSTN